MIGGPRSLLVVVAALTNDSCKQIPPKKSEHSVVAVSCGKQTRTTRSIRNNNSTYNVGEISGVKETQLWNLLSICLGIKKKLSYYAQNHCAETNFVTVQNLPHEDSENEQCAAEAISPVALRSLNALLHLASTIVAAGAATAHY